MNVFLTSRQRGFAIADALIAFVVMVIAGVALISLQGNLMNGSRSAKAQAEAMVIARDHTEMWRNYVEEAQYLAGPSSPSKPISPDKVQGVNAEFEVSYVNTPDVADDDESLIVSVCWEEGCADPDPDVQKIVSLESRLYYTKPEIASAIGEQHDSSNSAPPNFPSPWITGEEGTHPSTIPLTPDTTNNNLSATVTDTHRVMVLKDDGNGGTLISFEDQPVEIIYYVDPDSGRSNVEVVHGWLDEAETIPHVRLTSFGGGVNTIRGEIILHPGANTSLTDVSNHLQLLASPPSYCVFPICEEADALDDTACTKNENGAEYVSYVCYVPADCTLGGEGCDVQGSGDVPAERDTDVGFHPPIGREDMNGGWYGRVGNFNIFLDQSNDVVCVADTVKSSNLTPSREYVSYRCSVSLVNGECPSDNITGNEGVNRSFDCQSFIIATQNDVANNDDTACSILASSNYGINLPPENIIRYLVVSEKNTVLPLNSDYCGQ